MQASSALPLDGERPGRRASRSERTEMHRVHGRARTDVIARPAAPIGDWEFDHEGAILMARTLTAPKRDGLGAAAGSRGSRRQLRTQVAVRIAIYDYRYRHARPFLEAFAKGIGRCGRNFDRVPLGAPPARCDVAVVWGCWRRDVIAAQRLSGGRLLVLERGYLGNRKGWTSVGYDGLNGRADFCNEGVHDRRFRAHFDGLLHPWKDRGDYVLVMGQCRHDQSVRHVTCSVASRTRSARSARTRAGRCGFAPTPRIRHAGAAGSTPISGHPGRSDEPRALRRDDQQHERRRCGARGRSGHRARSRVDGVAGRRASRDGSNGAAASRSRSVGGRARVVPVDSEGARRGRLLGAPCGRRRARTQRRSPHMHDLYWTKSDPRTARTTRATDDDDTSFNCVLADQPHYLVPRHLLPTDVDTCAARALRVSPHCWFSWQGDAAPAIARNACHCRPDFGETFDTCGSRIGHGAAYSVLGRTALARLDRPPATGRPRARTERAKTRSSARTAPACSSIPRRSGPGATGLECRAIARCARVSYDVGYASVEQADLTRSTWARCGATTVACCARAR